MYKPSDVLAGEDEGHLGPNAKEEVVLLQLIDDGLCQRWQHGQRGGHNGKGERVKVAFQLQFVLPLDSQGNDRQECERNTGEADMVPQH
jgi:hypothetical protein